MKYKYDFVIKEDLGDMVILQNERGQKQIDKEELKYYEVKEK